MVWFTYNKRQDEKGSRGKNLEGKKRLHLIDFILKYGPFKTSKGVQTDYSTTAEYEAFFEGKINTGWFRSAVDERTTFRLHFLWHILLGTKQQMNQFFGRI